VKSEDQKRLQQRRKDKAMTKQANQTNSFPFVFIRGQFFLATNPTGKDYETNPLNEFLMLSQQTPDTQLW